MQNIIHANVPVCLLKLKKVPGGEIDIGERTPRIEGGMYKERSGELTLFIRFISPIAESLRAPKPLCVSFQRVRRVAYLRFYEAYAQLCVVRQRKKEARIHAH